MVYYTQCIIWFKNTHVIYNRNTLSLYTLHVYYGDNIHEKYMFFLILSIL
jgi:hypothetical protein